MSRWHEGVLSGFVYGILLVAAGCDFVEGDRVAAEGSQSVGAKEKEVARESGRDRPLKWGIYQILHWPDGYGASLDAEIERLGGKPDYVLFFRDLSSVYPARICEVIIERGATPVISVELTHWGGTRKGRLEAIVAGKYDRVFASFAEQAARSGQGVLYRFGFEMNGDWFAWGNQRELFKAAWCRVHDIFGSAGCRNVKWLWSANAISGPDTPENGMEKYWPGEEYVDVIGLDGYNFGDDHSEWHSWTSFEDVFRPGLDLIRGSGVGHPVLISEFGCADTSDGRRAQWIRDAHRFLLTRPEVVGAIWFNFDKRREGEANWRIDADAGSLRAWRETFGARGVKRKDAP